MARNRQIDEVTGVETTGHEWDGIRELDKPLPRWWLWTFYGTIVWALIYTILYPAWPLVNGATEGLLGYSTRAEVAREIEAFRQKNAALDKALAEADLTGLDKSDPVYRYALSRGAAVFRTWCAQCHGAGAQGARGYPNLLDDDWLWGGDIESILYTISHGVRNQQDPDARFSEMPAFGEILEPEEIAAVVQYVRKISGQDHDPALAEAGAVVFQDNCAACHGEDGKGDREVGAPDLTDAIWLYGGDEETLTETVTRSRFGVMPAWSTRLSEADIKAVATYVHELGGGE